MSIDKLQDMIRKRKNPSVVEFCADVSLIPPAVLTESDSAASAFYRYYMELLYALKDMICVVRFNLASFTLYGSEGVEVVMKLLREAKKLDYYVLLDAPVSYTERDASVAAQMLFADDSAYVCDGVVVCPYIGTDSMRPYADKIESTGKDVFVVLRTGNKTAGQLQDLLTGSRLVHIAVADMVSRLGQRCIGRKNYSAVACVGSAASADSLRNLRSKYRHLFILAEGYDYTNANAKNCSFAFDQMGHGAAVCAGSAVTGAWQAEPNGNYIAAAIEAAERMKKNLLRYITIL